MTTLNKNYTTIQGSDAVSSIDTTNQTQMGEVETDMTTIETDLTTLQGQFNTSTGHDHDGMDSKTVDHTTLTNKGTNTHSQIDSHIADEEIHTDKDTAAFNANRIQGIEVVTTNIANTQYLGYNEASGKFEPQNPGSPAEHKTTHENGGADEISLEGLDGTPAELTTHMNGTTVHGTTGNVVGTTDEQTLTNKTLTLPVFTNGAINFNAPEGFLINGKIVPSVASNNLTVAIKTLADTDPSASNPVYVRLNNVVRTITSALSVTKNAGTNWFNAGSAELATNSIDYFVYLGYNATDGVVIGFARISYAKQYSAFSTTTTDEKYCAISTITNAATTDSYSVIGRFAATLSAGAGYTWSVPTFTPSNLIQQPIYETRILSFTPTFTGFSSAPTVVARYSLNGSMCGLVVNVSNFGTSNANSYTQTVPIAAAFGTPVAVARIVDNSAQVAAGWGLLSTSTITFYKSTADTNTWTTSGLKGVGFSLTYLLN